MNLLGILLIWGIFGSLNSINSPKLEFSFGIFEKEIDQSLNHIYYSRHIPILLRYELPKFDVKSLHFDPYLKETPKDLCGHQFQGDCVNTIFIKKLINETFSGNLSFWNSFAPSKFVQTIPVDLCNTIKPHFDHTRFDNESSMEYYISELLKCEKAIEDTKGDYNYDFKPLYTNFSKIPGDVYWTMASPNNDDIIAMNAHGISYSIFFTNLLMESKRWRSAYDSCNLYRIPYSLLSNTELEAYLELIPENYVLSIPRENLKLYYQNKIADCAFMPDHLVVRILIPVLDEHLQYERLQLGAIPFFKKTKEQNESAGFVIQNINDVELIVEHTSGHFINKQALGCENQELCRVPLNPISTWSIIDNYCIYGFLSQSEQMILDFCPLEQIPKSIVEPIFYKSSSDRLIISDISQNNASMVSIFCENDSYFIEISLTQFGAQEIQLYCGCSLFYETSKIFSTEEPCTPFMDNQTAPYNLVHLVPIHWENEFYETFVGNLDNETVIDPDLFPPVNYTFHNLSLRNHKSVEKKMPTDPDIGIWRQEYMLYIILFGLIIALVSNIVLAYQMIKLIKWKKLQVENRSCKATIVQYNAFSNRDELYY